MIPRYTQPEMGAIWSDRHKYKTWLDVELAATDDSGRADRFVRAAEVNVEKAKRGKHH